MYAVDLGGAPVQTCDFNIAASWLWLNSHVSVGVFLRVSCLLLEYLFAGLLLGDHLCEKLVGIVPFVFITLTLFMCFFIHRIKILKAIFLLR